MEPFFDLLKAQLADDYNRWCDTWRRRSLAGHEDRTFSRYNDYYDQFKNAGVPIPWFKVVGNAFISWVQENFPDVLIPEENDVSIGGYLHA